MTLASAARLEPRRIFLRHRHRRRRRAVRRTSLAALVLVALAVVPQAVVDAFDSAMPGTACADCDRVVAARSAGVVLIDAPGRKPALTPALAPAVLRR